MSFKLAIAMTVLAMSSPAAWAQEQPEIRPKAAAELSLIFSPSGPLALTLPEDDPNLSQYSYAAVVTTIAPELGKRRFRKDPSRAAALTELINSIPEEERPEQWIRDYFANEGGRLVRYRTLGPGMVRLGKELANLQYKPTGEVKLLDIQYPATGYKHEFLLLATSARQAEQLAAAFITIYNRGWCEPQQQHWAQKSQQQSDLLGELRKQQATLQEDLDNAISQARKARFESVTPESLSRLKVELARLQTTQAGVVARLDKIRQLLSERKQLSSEAANHLEDLLIDGEIDLAGVKAQIDQANKEFADFQARWMRLVEAEQKVEDMQMQLKALTEQMRDAEVLASRYNRVKNSANFMPIDEPGKTVPIHTVRWSGQKRGGLFGGLFGG